MPVESTAQDLIKRLRLTEFEVSVAERAAELIRRYRDKGGGTWSGPTADDLVRAEIGDRSRQISVLSIACAVEKEARAEVVDPDAAHPAPAD